MSNIIRGMSVCWLSVYLLVFIYIYINIIESVMFIYIDVINLNDLFPRVLPNRYIA